MTRQVRRDNERIINTVRKKAVKDMQDWVLTLSSPPTKAEILAYQAGYIAGINRGTATK
jgi:hypothetical protein